MPRLFDRTAVITAGLIVVGLVAWFGSPMTFTNGVLLFIAGVVPPAIMLVLWKAPPVRIAEALPRVDASSRA